MNTIVLRRRFVAALTLACLQPFVLPASAQTTPHEVKTAPSGDQSDCSDGGQRTLMATVFGEPLYLQQVTLADVEIKRKELPQSRFDEWLSSHRGRRIYQIIWGRAYSRFREREQIVVTDNRAKLTAANKLQGVIPESPGKLLSGCSFSITITGDPWTENFKCPNMWRESLHERLFKRQERDR